MKAVLHQSCSHATGSGGACGIPDLCVIFAPQGRNCEFAKAPLQSFLLRFTAAIFDCYLAHPIPWHTQY